MTRARQSQSLSKSRDCGFRVLTSLVGSPKCVPPQRRSTTVQPKAWPVSGSLATGDKGEKRGGHRGGKLHKHSRANRGQKDRGFAVLHRKAGPVTEHAAYQSKWKEKDKKAVFWLCQWLKGIEKITARDYNIIMKSLENISMSQIHSELCF